MPYKVFGIESLGSFVVVAAIELAETSKHTKPPIKPISLNIFILVLQSMSKQSIAIE